MNYKDITLKLPENDLRKIKYCYLENTETEIKLLVDVDDSDEVKHLKDRIREYEKLLQLIKNSLNMTLYLCEK